MGDRQAVGGSTALQDKGSRIREYRYLAKQMRAMVVGMSHSEPRLTLIRLAEGYEKMAQLLEDNTDS